MAQLANMMSAQEFGQHYVLEQIEPLHPVARWRDPDAPIEAVDPSEDEPQTIEQIKARARAAGMAVS